MESWGTPRWGRHCHEMLRLFIIQIIVIKHSGVVVFGFTARPKSMMLTSAAAHRTMQSSVKESVNLQIVCTRSETHFQLCCTFI